MPRVVHFEFPVDDPDRATKFYQQVFSWEISKWPGPMDYWLAGTGAKDAPGINGAFMRRSPEFKQTVNTIDVPSLDEYMTKITAAGGSVVTPKTTIPTIGYFAYCTDTEGNVFGIIQFDPSAK
jgi:predicted enzyme related to lactoylglutathione lyase